MAKNDNLPGKNPWLNMWIAPRETISRILKFNPRYRFFLLSMLAGLTSLLYLAQSWNFGEYLPTLVLILGSIILAPFAGMLMVIISTFFFYWIGKLFKGKGTFLEIRCAVTWAYVTNVGNLIWWAILFALFDGVMFLRDFPGILCSHGYCGTWKASYFIITALWIWSVIILINTLSVAQKFSRWRAFFTLIITGAIVLAINLLLILNTTMGDPS